MATKSWQVGPKGGKYYVDAHGEKKYGDDALKSARQDMQHSKLQAVKAGGAKDAAARVATMSKLTQAKAMPKVAQLEPKPKPTLGAVEQAKAEPAPKPPSNEKAVGAIAPETARRLPKGKTPEEHVTIARDFLAGHKKDLDANVEAIRKLAPENGKTKGRAKELESALEKVAKKHEAANAKGAETKYKTVADLQDGTGIRVIAHSIDDVKATVDRIKATHKVLEEEDFISKAHPTSPGYRSHHLIVQMPGGKIAEVQVRTENQNTFADWAHQVYKPSPVQDLVLTSPNAKKNLEEYSRQMAEHFYSLDSGKKSTPPPCPQEAKRAFGCIS